MGDQKDFALGRHMTIEYYDCNHNILCDPKLVEEVFVNAAKASGATVLGANFHSFVPQGVSGFVVIAESHFSVHAWPEHDYAAVDIFTCGESIDFQIAVEALREGLKADQAIISSLMSRGIVSNCNMKRTVPVFKDKTQAYALSWQKRFESGNAWGLLSSIDLHGCSPSIICDAEAITSFVKQLCENLGVQRHGDCKIEHFEDDESNSGLSMTQLIDTSLISGHFVKSSNNAYLDIFSCKFYEPREVAEFAMNFFNGTNYRMQVALRQ